VRLPKAAGTANIDLRWAISPPGAEGGASRVTSPPVGPSPLPRDSIEACLLFHRIIIIKRKITIAAPATPPTTPPTTAGVDTAEVEFPLLLEVTVLEGAPIAAVPDDPVIIPPMKLDEAVSDDDDHSEELVLGEYA
jgi:hypothetical protein